MDGAAHWEGAEGGVPAYNHHTEEDPCTISLSRLAEEGKGCCEPSEYEWAHGIGSQPRGAQGDPHGRPAKGILDVCPAVRREGACERADMRQSPHTRRAWRVGISEPS